MSALNQHTVIVTSNVQDARNTSSHFYNVLGKSMDLSQGHWKVAIKKIIYLNSFLNIIDESVAITKRIVQEVTYKKPLKIPKWDPTVWPPHYEHSGIFGIEYFLDKKGRYVLILNILNHPNISNVEYMVKTAKSDDDPWVPYPKAKVDFIASDLGRHFSFDLEKDLGAKPTHVSVQCEWDQTFTYPIPQGNYENIKDLVTALNNTTKTAGAEFSVEKNNFIKIALAADVKSLQLNNDLNLTLGFNELQFTKAATATHLPQLNRGRFAFFIYSNLVHNVRVGDTEAPLMDVISIPKQEFADIISLDVVNPLYSDVSLKQVHEIEIMLASDSGELIKFDNSVGNAKTLIVLHFVKVI